MRQGTMEQCRRHAVMAAALAVACAIAQAADADYELMRQRALGRERLIIYNNDGDDMQRYPTNKPITPEGFASQRLDYTKGTVVSEIAYSPSQSFAFYSLFRSGWPSTNTVSGGYAGEGCRNATLDFWAKGLDCLQMAIDYAHARGMYGTLSIRMNDTHDAWMPAEMMSPFKRLHPECMMAPSAKDAGEGPRYGAWSSVDFTHALVRNTAFKVVRDFCAGYDFDVLEIDFCRHLVVFKSVWLGGEASMKEVESMTVLMRDIRAAVDAAGRRRGRPILVRVRVADSPEYDRAIGLDVATWLRHGYVDEVVGGCYFRLNDWAQMAGLCHQYGAKFYASLDETRIPGICARSKPPRPIIPGRGTLEFQHARFAECMDAGCDGIYLFNHEYGTLQRHAQVSPRETDGLDKIYFATERGGGGYRCDYYLKNGARFRNVAYIDPSQPMGAWEGIPVNFSIRIGDDFAKAAAKGLRPNVTALALTGRTDGNGIGLWMNGTQLKMASVKNGLASFPVDPSIVRKGLNVFRFMVLSGDRTTFNDFAVKIQYTK
ncbi:MAG: hypothetical protein IKO72_14535 [Kiritimatiellae bacterium]|nr:hypothetical protein [Kiritimatiellia bacterium]